MRYRAISLWIAATLAGAVLTACGGGAPGSLAPVSNLPHPSSGSSPIQHIVLIVQENRSYDNLFATFMSSGGKVYGYEKVKRGGRYVSKRIALKEQHLIASPDTDIGHCYYAFIQAYDGGKMDGFNLEPKGLCQRNWSRGQAAGRYPYQYVYPSDIAPYWDMAEQYVLSDAMFQTQGSGSFTAHQDLIRGGSALSGTYGSSASLIDTPTQIPWGCDSPKASVTNLITTTLKWEANAGPFPCSKDFPYYNGSTSYRTLADLLDQAGVSWKYYSPCYKGSYGYGTCPKSESCPPPTECAGGELNAFDVIYGVRYGNEWGTNVSMPETNIFNDISNNSLPAVSWVIPEDCNSDHLGERDLQTGKSCDSGPEWVASVVNALGQSSYWDSTAIIVTWDDWGGLYDSAEPPTPGGASGHQRDDQGGLGLRVPMIVVSPYAKIGQESQGGYIDSTPYEFGSILKYIENNFGLGSLGTTDKRAMSIGDAFNYNQQPRQFQTIPSTLDARYFEAHSGKPQHGDPQ